MGITTKEATKFTQQKPVKPGEYSPKKMTGVLVVHGGKICELVPLRVVKPKMAPLACCRSTF